MKIQILLIFIIFVLIFFIYKFYVEHFDARVSDVTIEKCGDMCTKIFGCVGFSYDKTKKKCYLSTNPLVGYPEKSLYADEYRNYFNFCNKPNPIKNVNDMNLPDALPKNTIYTCKQGENGLISLNSILDEKINKIKFKNPKIEIKDYDLKPLYWESIQSKKDIEPNFVTKNDYLNKISFFDYDNKNEYDGTYMFQDKCINNVPLFDCLGKCAKEDSCVGVEFNPSKNNDNNICCPKTHIFNKKKRTKENELGVYYTKKLEDSARLGDIYIRNN